MTPFPPIVCLSEPIGKPPTSNRWRRASLGLILALLPTGAMAATKVWNNTSGNTDWNTGAFWTAAGVPGSGDIVQFTGAAVANPNISASTAVNILQFTGAASSGYTISANSGQALTLLSSGTGGSSALGANNTSGTNTFSANLILGQAAATTATFSQTVGGTLVLSGNISSTNAIAGLTLVSAGAITLSGNNTYSGITTLSNIGAVNLNHASAISSGTLVVGSSSTLGNTSGAAITLANNNAITLSNQLTFTATAATGDLSFGSGVVTLTADRAILVTNLGSTLTIGSLNADTTARILTIGSTSTAGKLSIANAAGSNLQGKIQFAGGVLEIGNKSALGTGTIEWQQDQLNAGVKTLQASTDLTGANAVANAMQLGTSSNVIGPSIIGGTHAIEFSGTLSSVGNARTLTINNTALTTFSGDVKLTQAFGVFNLTLNGSGNTLISGAISQFIASGSGTAGLTYAGTGTLTLSNSGSTYSAATTVNSGTIAYGANQATPSASATVINATAASGSARFDLAGFNSTMSSLTFGGTTAGANATNTLSTGAGTLTLGGNVTYTKATLDANDPGTATLSGNLALGATRTFTIADSTNTTNELNLTAAISGATFGLTKAGAGNLTLSGANTYTGVTTVSAGTLQFAKQTSLYNSNPADWIKTNLVVNSGGTLAFNVGGTDEFTASDLDTLQTNLKTSINNNGFRSGSNLALDTTNATGGTFTYNTAITNSTGTGSGAVGLSKLGSNTLILGGTNTYTGATLVTAGTLLINGSGTINSTSSIAINAATAKLNYQSNVALTRAVTVINGGTFAHNSSENFSGTITLTNGKLGGTNWNGNLAGLTIGTNQTITPGNSPGTAITSTQTWAGGGSYDWEINQATGGTAGADPGWDLVNFTTGLDITATTGSRFTINVISLTLTNVAGAATGFDSALDYQWLIADSASAITSFSADKFSLNLSAFTNAYNGVFAIDRGDSLGIGGDNTQLYLTYTAAVPEPSAFALLTSGLVAMMVFRRRLRAN